MKLVLSLVAVTAMAGLVGLGFVSARQAVSNPGLPVAAPVSVPSDVPSRLAAIEARLAAIETGQRAGAAGDERYLVALLHLQNVVRTARPWQRELQLLLQLAGPERLNGKLVAVLQTHAAQGIATRPELRRDFLLARRALLADAPSESGMIQGLLQGGQAAVAGLGLAAPPPPGRTESTLASIGHHLDRGDLAAALHDAALLDVRLQPRMAEWMVQVRVRLAVEQAIQELLAQSLAAGRGEP